MGKKSREKRERRATSAGGGTSFLRAREKLDEARALLDRLHECGDFDSFKGLYHGFLAAARAVTYAMQKEGAHMPGFKEWYEPRRRQMQQDELMRFIHDARVRDFHQAEPSVAAVSTHVDTFSVGSAGPPPTPDATLGMGPDGIYWVIAAGTAKERRIPVRSGGRWTTTVALVEPPASHQGQTLKQRDPLAIAALAVSYLEELLYEAKAHLAPSSD